MKIASRTLGLVFWLEAPAIYMLFMLASYGTLITLDEYGLASDWRLNIHFAFMGLGTIAASAYIWLVAENTSRRLFTVAARFVAVVYVALFVLVIWESVVDGHA